jgi:hypothetical protein
LISERRETRPAVAGWVVFAVLLALYLLALAPRVTFWDAGEFIAAIESWGIPHPPGTPLYVTLGRSVLVLLGGLPTALVVNALSAVLTAAACALGATLLARRTGVTGGAIAAGLCAGCATSAWLSAAEAEVYSASLLLSALMLVVAATAADLQRSGEPERATRRRMLLAYLFALAAPLHASALVAGPAAIWLCSDDAAVDPELRQGRKWRIAMLGAALVAAGGLATGRFALAAAAALVLAGLAIAESMQPAATRAATGGVRTLAALALGATPLLIMLLRAGFDPAINQGNPATLHALGDEIARRQYDVAALWPRQAPPWLQLANVFQYADWQFGLGLAPETTFSAIRLTVSLVFVALAAIGGRAHRARDPRSFRAFVVLMVSASLGVLVYLNLKAGPSIGWGILPDSMPHEARDRDYFFTLAFWGWGLWAGFGAVVLARRWLPPHARTATIAGVAVAMLPALLNWRAMNRRREPDASAATMVANALLGSTPPNGVLVVWGDNDSYPLWEAQRARSVRRDVIVVTSPLLGATWYRDELRRRYGLDAGSLAPERAMVARVVASARDRGRPVAIAVTVPAEVRAAAGSSWSLCGLAWTSDAGRCAFAQRDSIDRWLDAHPPGRFTDNTVRAMLDPLRCPRLAARAPTDSAAADSLAGACNTR